MQSGYFTLLTNELKSAVDSRPRNDATEMMPVKCFYGSATFSAKPGAEHNPVDATICCRSTTPSEKLSNVVTKQLRLKQAKTVKHFGDKRLRANYGSYKPGLTSANQKTKTVERRKLVSGTRVKQTGGMKPPRATSYSALIFKTLDNELHASDHDERAADVVCAPVEKENLCKDSNIKRFFKNRATGTRKHITSVGGRCVDVESLSKALNKNVLRNSASLGVGKSSLSHLISESACSSNAVGDVSRSDALVVGAEHYSELCTSSEQKFDSGAALDQQNLEPFQMSNCLSSGKNFALDVVDSTRLNGLPSKTDMMQDSAIPSTSVLNEQVMTSPTSSSVAVSTPLRMMLRSPSSWSSICSPVLPVNRNSPVLSPDHEIKRKSADTPSKFSMKKDKKEQMILDFGQKLHGTVNCSTCGMTYARRHPGDELTHSQYHRDLFRILNFAGKSSARVAQDFLDGNYVVVVTAEDRRLCKRVEDIKEIVDKELGFVVESVHSSYAKGYRMQNFGDPGKTQCCSDEPVPVRCAISRIWVLASHRRKGIASRLVDVVRGHFMMGYPLSLNDIAFSDPTPDGAKFAAKYCQTEHFLVYNKNPA